MLAQAGPTGAAGKVWLWQAVAAGEAGGVVRKQQGNKFWSGHAVNEPALSMSRGKPSLLLAAPAGPAWEHVPLPYRQYA